MVEHGFRKAGVMGSSPVIGCIDFEKVLAYEYKRHNNAGKGSPV
jgi:hypothetical protein